MRKGRMWYRGAPWLGALAIGVLAFGFHSHGAPPEKDQASPTFAKSDARTPVDAVKAKQAQLRAEQAPTHPVRSSLTAAAAPPPAKKRVEAPEPTENVLSTSSDASNSFARVPGAELLPTRRTSVVDSIDLPARGGPPKLTCSNDDSTVDAGNMVACQPAADNRIARCFPAVGAMNVVGVRFGLEAVNETLTITIGLYDDTNGCPPSIANMVLLGETSIVVTAADNLTILTVPLAVSVPVGTNLVVDASYTTVVAGAWLGGNIAGQTCPTYIQSVACGLTDYSDLAAIGFPDAAWVVSVDGGTDCGDGVCDPGEDCCNCAADCGQCAGCGDGTCCEADGENCDNCAADCGACPVCGDPNAGDCCDPAGTGSPGCSDAACCDLVCGMDPFCCDVEWDNICAGEAAEFPDCNCTECGNGIREGSEECDGADDDACPGNCQADCTCPLGGGGKLTCSVSETVEAGNMVACQPAADNRIARCFPSVDAMEVFAVRFGLEAVNETLTITIGLYDDTNGCPPTVGNMVLLGETSIVVTAADNLTVLTVPLAVSVPAGTNLVVDAAYTTVVAGAWLGGNFAGQTCPTYIQSVACGLTDYSDLAAIGFPDAAWVVSVDFPVGECGNQICEPGETCCNCPGDCGDCVCGDGECSGACGEDCGTCEADCGACPAGACCDDDTGVCNDGVLETDCPAGSRFALDTLCADLEPQCGDVIPTVSEWGLIVMALLVVSAGVVIVRRRMADQLPA